MMFPEGIDTEIVSPGIPEEPGWWLVWHDQWGWPAVSIVQVQVDEGRTTWWVGTAGTDQVFDVRNLVKAAWDAFIGYSPVTEHAFEYFKSQWENTRQEVLKMLKEKP